jgi:hydroxymethylpyrimidine/phosphomethylpyrimidine kinase
VRTILGRSAESIEEMVEAGRAIQLLGARAVLVKGGHRDGDPVDVLVDESASPLVLRSARVNTSATHGTGCTYASSIAAALALGAPLVAAVTGAHAYVRAGI